MNKNFENQEDEIPEGYIRVTDVLKRYSNLEHIPKDVLEKAADRGTRVHHYCELYSRHFLFEEVDEDCKNYVDSFKRWFDAEVEEIMMIENRINNPLYMLSGKIDLVAKLRSTGKFTIIDIKTPATPSKTWPLQTSAYSWLLDHVSKIKVVNRGCLVLPKCAKHAEFIEHKNHSIDRERFTCALNLHYYFNT